jgi:hypothetical protein
MTTPGIRTAAAPLALIAGLLLGCGGKHGEPTPASGGAGDVQATAGGGESGGGIVPPEKMDEINRTLQRKQPTMSRCLAGAVDSGELPRNSRGKVTLEIVISPAGRADTVKIVRATLASKALDDCIIGHIKEIQFPELPGPYETSFTYGFEAM